MNEFNTSVFHNFSRLRGVLPLHEVLLSVKQNKLQSKIGQIRQLSIQGKKELADNLKKTLPAFTPAGVFTKGRRLSSLQEYNPVICLDFDNVKEPIENLRKIVDALSTTYASFISPKGNGLKVFVITNSTKEKHLIAFNRVADFYEQQTGILSDRSVKDIPRLCFLSYDPDLYLNISSEIFPIEVIEKNEISKNSISSPDFAEIFANCQTITEKNGSYINGNRNNFIFRFANCCKHSGIPLQQTLTFCRSHYNLDNKELEAVIRSAFSYNDTEFAKFAKFATSCDFFDSSLPAVGRDDDFLTNSPSISQEDYDLMPDMIKQGVLCFTDPRERDVFFTGALSILSACLPHIIGEYNRQPVYPNLFSFIIAPPASGKGSLKYSRLLGGIIQSKLLEVSQKEERKYQKELHLYKQRKRKKNSNPDEEPPSRPPFRVFYIPANSSYAKVLNHLSENGGTGVICETEADTMGYILKQDWGSYSDMLRKAFHHESISSSRKTDNQYIEVTNPRLSVALTGTPGQILGLISSADDGLFSRFLFYVYKSIPVWNDVSPQPDLPCLTDTFSKLSMDIYHMMTLMADMESTFVLTPEHWKLLNESFTHLLTHVTTFNSVNAASIVKRLGLLLYRMAMIFTTLRNYELNIQEKEMVCSDQDFHLALRLSRLYLEHSLIMFNSLPKEDCKVVFTEAPNKEAFYNSLPPTFSRADAITLGMKYHLRTRSIDGLLKKLLESKLKKSGTGLYEKV